MRIGIEAQRVLRPNRHGMDVVTLHLVRNLLQADSKSDYIVYIDRPDTDDVLGTWPNLTKRVVRCPTYPLWEQVALPLAMARDGIDVAHFTSSTGPLAWRGPTVLTLHDVIFLAPSTGPGGSLYQRLGRIYRRWVVPTVARQARRVLTVSNYERERIRHELTLRDGGVHVVHNGVGKPFLGSTRSLVTRLSWVPEHYFLFLGSRAPKKNAARAIQAWAELALRDPEAPALVVTELGREEVRVVLRAAGLDALQHRVHTPGYVPHEQLVSLYAHAVAFVYPSLVESFGLPMLEAMATGTPVLAASSTCIPEVAGDAALLVDPTCVSTMRDGLQRIWKDAGLRRRLVERGLQRVSKFGWDRMACEVSEHYRAVHAA